MSRIRCELEPIRDEKGVPVGFKAKGGWTGPGTKGQTDLSGKGSSVL